MQPRASPAPTAEPALRIARHVTRRFLAVGFAVDGFFVVFTGAAFALVRSVAGAPLRLVIIAAAAAHLFKETAMALVIWAALRPIERWIAARGTARDVPTLLARAGEAAYRAPHVIGAGWCVLWTAVYPAAGWALTSSLPPDLPLRGNAMLATVLMAGSLAAAALSLSYTVSGALIAPTAGALSLVARSRGVTLRGSSVSLRTRLVILMVCLAVGPSVWMLSFHFMDTWHAGLHMDHATKLTLMLFAFVASSWGPICAFFLTGALAQPLKNIADMIQEIVRRGDPRQATMRAPVYYRDEIGKLAEGVNEMTDRLALTSERIEQQVLELSTACREAREAIRARDEFLSVAAHELRTPLTSLALTIQSLGRRARGQGRAVTPGDLVSGFSLAGRQILVFQKLVEGLLDVSRIVEGRVHVEPEPLDLAELVREATGRLEEAAARARCALSVRADAPVPGSWDPMRLEQIVTNLVANAIKFGGGQPIEVELTCDDETARLRVTDHGIGIAPADQERIFQRFERAVSIDRYGGLGLGLWITRQLLDALGGRIHVESRPGEGSTFVVELPRRPRSEP